MGNDVIKLTDTQKQLIHKMTHNILTKEQRIYLQVLEKYWLLVGLQYVHLDAIRSILSKNMYHDHQKQWLNLLEKEINMPIETYKQYQKNLIRINIDMKRGINDEQR